MLAGLNHLTLAVRDVAISAAFYRDLLGFTLRATWDGGAYLSLGELWLCLSLDEVDDRRDYTHYAFTLPEDALAAFRARLLDAGVIEWKTNKSEGASFYFLDPDGHRLEAHCGDLQSRLAACREAPYAGMVFY
ncbi:glutathione transferase [Pluralibacter gergoviae]|uniref:fosfomycin resistance glutathione transferase n=1 Tax=Pluralibacter gergoviae TaxID=61647 RepID=UPI000651484A|nr:fosfomycin resistance glutathione transferase [Pluralibacter gergoviae]KMK19742.1 glutathione transferase [Pluralibacter gergoviae]